MRLRLIATSALLLVSFACENTTSAQQAKPKTAAVSTKPADLDGMLAPIALYPESLLAQMLMCAGTPNSVVALNKWLASNTTLKGTALQDAATADGFEPEFVAMALFPSIVKFMADQIDWTTRLGQAFAMDKQAVFGSIQRLRKNAQDKGTLKDSAQQDVQTKTTSGGEQVIVIEPTNPQVIYVPTYNPQVVYTSPPATTVVVQEDNSGEAALAGVIGFTAGIAIGAAMDNNYYYGPYGWHGGAYMYNDAWDDYYDHREDAREDWQDHREDVLEERGDRREDVSENRGERTENRGETRSDVAGQRTDRQQNRTENRPQSSSASAQSAGAQRSTQSRSTTAQGSSAQPRTSSPSYESRGYSGSGNTSAQAAQRSGTKSDAFSGYSSGTSTRSASSRGHSSRSSSRGGGGGGGRRR
jgi:hypothetical protein